MSEIRIHNLSKSFGKISAVRDVSLEIHSAELFGLIGPDGAGKSTLIRLMTTLLLPDTGEIKMGNLDVVDDYKQLRHMIGYMPGKFSLYHDLSVEENLTFFATVFGSSIEENYDLVKDIYRQIEPFKKRRAGNLSGGMKQKLALSCALIHKPTFLILDEPTTGVDAVSRVEFWDMLDNLKAQGITIFVSTPYMDEAMRCERVALMQDGSIMAVDNPGDIPQRFPGKLYAIGADEMYQLKMYLQDSELVESVSLFGQSLHVVPKNGVSVQQMKSECRHKGFKNLTCKSIKPVIEDVFIELMSKQKKEQDAGR
ncbi:MAG: ABC transporter ATP-binding protein [Candidatus Delongbacteria bacterium]|jgi:ABC-2 type transport system ATP-binding protein|nr:ABC transporter ATP-binding protein [Candidatus Delongbacteria bacterium]